MPHLPPQDAPPLTRRRFVASAAGLGSVLASSRLSADGHGDGGPASCGGDSSDLPRDDGRLDGFAPGNPTAPANAQLLRVDGERLAEVWAGLRRFGGTPEGGTTRLAYSEEDLAAREYVAGVMEQAGLAVSVDVAGNLIGSRAGAGAVPVASDAALMTGSHIDTVPGGGSYDGQIGVAGALEAALTLRDHGVELRRPLEVVVFQNEEGGKTGSRALAGRVQAMELDIVTASGYTIREGIGRLGGDATRLRAARRAPGSVAGFVELHIEQGGLLAEEGVQIGVVEGIVGIRRWNVVVRGTTNHAGTTPMAQRRDALVAAARLIEAVNETALETEGRQVATVGKIEAEPGVPNVVPGVVRATLEIRDLRMEKIDAVFRAVEAHARDIEEEMDVSIDFSRFYESLAAPTAPRFRDIVEEAAEALGFSHARMPSGAGHDAQSMAQIGPAGMIFVPSRDGVSHSPLEYTSPADIERGANVLLQSLLALDRE